MTPVVDYAYRATVLRVIDADTLDVEVDVGFRMFARMPLRLYGCNAPERYTQEGAEASNYVTSLLGKIPCPVIVETVKPIDKYGRYLANVFIGDIDLGQELISSGHAVVYLP